MTPLISWNWLIAFLSLFFFEKINSIHGLWPNLYSVQYTEAVVACKLQLST